MTGQLHRRLKALASAAAMVITVAVISAADYQPAHLLSGTAPKVPFNAIGWVEAVIDLEVDAAGHVVKTTGLRATPGGLDAVLPALKDWRFRAANDGERAVASHVLVATMMRPAQLFDPAGGSPAVDLKPPIDGALFPTSMTRPKYPARRVGDRVVVVEAQVAANGRVERAAIVGPTSGFDEDAQSTARSWVFSAARHDGSTVPGVAYLIFGYRAPVSVP
jgi:TonB family protein